MPLSFIFWRYNIPLIIGTFDVLEIRVQKKVYCIQKPLTSQNLTAHTMAKIGVNPDIFSVLYGDQEFL
jgi:hypothetical protein